MIVYPGVKLRIRLKTFRASLAVFLLIAASGDCSGDTYGESPAAAYLTGRFDPAVHSRFIRLSDMGIPTDGRPHYLRREAAEALVKLYGAFHAAHPRIPFRVRSSTRSFYDQKAIWEDKWNGKTLVDGSRLNITFKKPLERARVILRYSSMPGTSRHHWGTDFDINELNNSYYATGEGAVIYEWMKKNAADYGFCQPYTAGRSAGYEEERWHWSYMPLAREFLHDWIRSFSGDTKLLYRDGDFSGAGIVSGEAPVYVESINPLCK